MFAADAATSVQLATFVVGATVSVVHRVAMNVGAVPLLSVQASTAVGPLSVAWEQLVVVQLFDALAVAEAQPASGV